MNQYDERNWAKAASQQVSSGLGQVSGGNLLAEQEKEIPNRLSTLGYELNELQTALDQLRSRLQPVSSPRPEEACETVATPSGTSIGGVLMDITERIRAYTNRVRSILIELEI